MTNREFKVGDEVFSTLYGIGKVTDVIEEAPYPIETDIYFQSAYTADGKVFRDNKYPSLFHIDEALKLFPMWLEEAEESVIEVRYGTYDVSNQAMNPKTSQYKDSFLTLSDHIVSEIHIPTKRKIIREKQ